ncbi:hypothetical protein PP939_gp114 [Rhizobium phage RL38J1]|uniref:Uncharacterized protein n=2 Tax=Innesvirus TaxID=3044739 RepID=A0A6B9J1U9_9CAUD|nr:hypothetical protein PP939_gp114 [Rhizobium phage RL38J1]YP_010662869.1 hypothetical protein PP940_gp191 [Rhizobium phage RL2RES]QGZ13987.1 hypothetical protein RL38J1_114 [Rhizobium phage RL38J1]QGZ14264.1 hypothetical protein RL2RES_191 [Rhizobium phage RL2RES]
MKAKRFDLSPSRYMIPKPPVMMKKVDRIDYSALSTKTLKEISDVAETNTKRNRADFLRNDFSDNMRKIEAIKSELLKRDPFANTKIGDTLSDPYNPFG